MIQGAGKEYRTLEFGYDDPQERLNELAAEGWQVAERIDRDGCTWAFLLEREVGGGAST